MKVYCVIGNLLYLNAKHCTCCCRPTANPWGHSTWRSAQRYSMHRQKRCTPTVWDWSQRNELTTSQLKLRTKLLNGLRYISTLCMHVAKCLTYCVPSLNGACTCTDVCYQILFGNNFSCNICSFIYQKLFLHEI